MGVLPLMNYIVLSNNISSGFSSLISVKAECPLDSGHRGRRDCHCHVCSFSKFTGTEPPPLQRGRIVPISFHFLFFSLPLVVALKLSERTMEVSLT